MRPSRVDRRYNPITSRGARKLKRDNKTAVGTIVCLPAQLAPDYACDTPLQNCKILFSRGKVKKNCSSATLLQKLISRLRGLPTKPHQKFAVFSTTVSTIKVSQHHLALHT